MEQTGPIRVSEPPRLAIGLFTETTSVRDAVADLREAGFETSQIYVAFSAEHDSVDPKHEQLWQGHGKGLFGGEHSVPWRIRHSFERDLHRRGAESMGPHAASAEGKAASECTEVNLHDILTSIGVAESRIWLVNRQVGQNGALVIVDALTRKRQAESILIRNCGQIRTDTATELPLSE
jgi:hypothetical protein